MSYQLERNNAFPTGLTVIPRRAWLALGAKFRRPLQPPATNLMYSFTRTPTCQDLDSCCRIVLDLQQTHQSHSLRYIPDIKYNFLIGGDGRVYMGRGWWVQPTLPSKWVDMASSTIYVAFIGDFADEDPPVTMFSAQERLIRYGMEKKYITKKFTEFTLHY